MGAKREGEVKPRVSARVNVYVGNACVGKQITGE